MTLENHQSTAFRTFHLYEDNEYILTGIVKEIAEYLDFSHNWVNYLIRENKTTKVRGKLISFELASDPYELEYALYKGENLLAIGTLEEIAEQTGKSLQRVKYYRTPRAKREALHWKTPTVLVCLEGDDY